MTPPDPLKTLQDLLDALKPEPDDPERVVITSDQALQLAFLVIKAIKRIELEKRLRGG